MPTFPLPLTSAYVMAYIEATFVEARHGNTFSKEAQALIKEMSEPDLTLAELFTTIERQPHGPFEKALKLRAHRIMLSK